MDISLPLRGEGNIPLRGIVSRQGMINEDLDGISLADLLVPAEEEEEEEEEGEEEHA